MTREQFKALPYLLMEHHVVALGYSRQTVAKFVDCAVLARICPKGSGQARYQKRQLAQLLKWDDCLDGESFRSEPPLMTAKAVQRWTGWSESTLAGIVAAGGLSLVKPPGASKGKFLKDEIGRLIGVSATDGHR